MVSYTSFETLLLSWSNSTGKFIPANAMKIYQVAIKRFIVVFVLFRGYKRRLPINQS